MKILNLYAGIGGNRKLWGDEHEITAVEINQDAVRRYIQEQQGKDVFEYSVFGDVTGQTKIGDFSNV